MYNWRTLISSSLKGDIQEFHSYLKYFFFRQLHIESKSQSLNFSQKSDEGETNINVYLYKKTLSEVREKLKNKKEKEPIYLRVNFCEVILGWLMHIIKTTHLSDRLHVPR